MPTSDIGAVAGAVKSVADLIGGVLDRSDRDAPDKELNENLIRIQNGFADNDLDSVDFRRFIDQLCNKAGESLTPTRDVGFGRRELLHSLLICAAKLIHERELVSRLVAKRNSP